MLPFYYRAVRYSWNEDRYRTPGVDGAKAVPEIGADGVALAPQAYPEATPVREKAGASKEAKTAEAQAPDNAYLPASAAPPGDLSPHPFHLPTQWNSQAALRALGTPKFLVALDLWAMDSGVLEGAEALAEKYRAQLLLAHVVTGAGAEREEEEIRRRLRAFPAAFEFHSFPGAPPATVLLREAKRLQASLLILATHGRRGKERVLEGSVAEEVLKQAAIPVLIHRPGTRWPNLGKILVPFDDLRAATPAVAPAAKLGKSFGAELWLMHVRESQGQATEVGEDAAKWLARMPQGHSEVREVAAQGGVPESIAAFAEAEGIDLLVMPSQREDLSQKILPGGVTAQVARQVSCSVLVVPK